MKKQIYSLSVFILTLALVITACTSLDDLINGEGDYDFDKLSDDINWTPNMTFPVVRGKFTLWYLINPNAEVDTTAEEGTAATLVVDPVTGLLHIKNTQENVFEYDAGEVINFPDQQPQDVVFDIPAAVATGGVIPVPDGIVETELGSITDETNFEIEKGVKIKSLDLSTQINFEIDNPLPGDVKIELAFPNGTQSGDTAATVITVPANSSGCQRVWDLSDLSLDFSENYPDANMLDFDLSFFLIWPEDEDCEYFVSGTEPPPYTGLGISNYYVQSPSPGSQISLTYTLGSIEFTKVTGDFGQQVIDIGSGGFEMAMDFWDDVAGNFIFNDPRINLTLHNGVGVPFQLDLNLTGYKKQDSISLDAEPLLPGYPENDAQVDARVTSTVSCDTTNSKIRDLMALPPTDSITYSGQIVLNPDPVDISQPNIIKNNSAIGVDLEMDIPMDFSAQNLEIRDTMDISMSNAGKIKNASLTFIAKNGWPLNVAIKMYFADEQYTIIDSVPNVDIFTAAEVFPQGVSHAGEVDITKVLEKVSKIELTEGIISKLDQTKNIIIVVTLGTGNDGIPVKLLEHNTLEFSIAIQAEADLND